MLSEAKHLRISLKINTRIACSAHDGNLLKQYARNIRTCTVHLQLAMSS